MRSLAYLLVALKNAAYPHARRDKKGGTAQCRLPRFNAMHDNPNTRTAYAKRSRDPVFIEQWPQNVYESTALPEQDDEVKPAATGATVLQPGSTRA